MITLIGARCTHSNVFSQGLLITRILLGNMTSTYSVGYHYAVSRIIVGCHSFMVCEEERSKGRL